MVANILSSCISGIRDTVAYEAYGTIILVIILRPLQYQGWQGLEEKQDLGDGWSKSFSEAIGLCPRAPNSHK